MSPGDMHDLEQSMAAMRDFIPTMWWGLYEESLKRGFTKDQAMALVITHVATNGGNGKVNVVLPNGG